MCNACNVDIKENLKGKSIEELRNLADDLLISYEADEEKDSLFNRLSAMLLV